MPESTHGWEAKSPRRTWTECRRGNWQGDAKDDLTNQRGFDPARVESFLNASETDRSVDLMVETQGFHKAEGHSVGTPAETALRHIQLW